ncbi:MAG: preprotein translocase subunit SecY [Clostridia bacterium]
MLQTLRNAWKIPDLRKKMLYTLLMLVIFRLGSYIPVPGLTADAVAQMMGGFSEGMQGLLNNFSGGALERGSIFAMSISPYINASIIIQLLTVAIPALERLSKEGEEGRKKLSSYTRYGTVILGFLQATGLYFGLRNNLIGGPGVMNFIILTLSFTAGTAFLMWLGEEITDKGIGNGISLLIFTGIVSRGPAMIQSLRASLVTAEGMNIQSLVTLIAILAIAILAIAFVVLMNDAERRIPVQYAKRVVGRKMYGGQSTHIPIKLAMAGVMPIIFAISIMSFPQTINMFINGETMPEGFWGVVLSLFRQTHPFYIIAYFLLIVFFTYFYTAIQFNPIEISNNMKKNGGFIPGIRPGKPTSDFISRILSKITLFGSLFLAVVAIFPILLAFVPNLSGISIGGTSLLIVVGVALETVKQMESQMLMRHYKGFLE